MLDLFDNSGMEKTTEKAESIRQPKQKRSISTKEKILDAAYQLFCEKGYFKTTTNEIARVAGVSIGSLYSYFADKDTIFLEILDRYHETFMVVHDRLVQNMGYSNLDMRKWLRQFIDGMIQVHEISKELNQEIKILCYSKPEVKAITERHSEQSRQMAYDYLLASREYLRVTDIEAAAEVSYNLITDTVDQIVFGSGTFDRERLIEATLDALDRYLLK
jgi:AcrR family transcriptional regulator